MHTDDIRLIAMDMDGTLLDSEQRLSQGNIAALHAAQQSGIRLAISSGRLPGDIAGFLADAGMEDCAILALNGGYCTRRMLDGAFANHTLSMQTLQETLRILKDAGILFACFAQNRLVIYEGAQPDEALFWATNNEGAYAPQYLYGDEGLRTVLPQGINKLVCTGPDKCCMAQVRARLAQVPQLEVTSSWPLNLELMPGGVCKGEAVRQLAEEMGISAAQVIAIGDYDNDLTMIAYAGHGVAMGNATQAVRSAARHTTRTNDEDGVAWAIYRYALGRDMPE